MPRTPRMSIISRSLYHQVFEKLILSWPNAYIDLRNAFLLSSGENQRRVHEGWKPARLCFGQRAWEVKEVDEMDPNGWSA